MKKLLMAFLCLSSSVLAQKKNNNFNYFIKKTDLPIRIDGKIDEAAWQNCQIASDFYQVLPMDTSKAIVKTEVMLTYDNQNLYVVFINHNKIKGSNMVESMKRDFNFGKNDNDLLFFDTYNDLTNGFSFGSNARGGQWDGLMFNGSSINLSWDNKWQSEVSFDDDKWIWEAAIPFKTLRYNHEIKNWGVNFSRLDLKTTEKSSWTPIPRQFPTATLGFTGNLVWDDLLPKSGANISLIPYLAARNSKDFVNQSNAKPGDINFGLDAKIGVSSNLNLDLTVNPDFSQVEVDVQQTNLDRFELQFPERRQFFIENGDLFNNYGFTNIRPFFSRRIGLDAPLQYGAKLSGKLNKNLRIGALNTQTGKSSTGELGSNYSVLSLQRKVFKRSSVSAIYIDRETVNPRDEETKLKDFNRTLGLEYNLASADNTWSGKIMALKVLSTPNSSPKNSIIAANIKKSTKSLSYGFQVEKVGYNVAGNEVGFLRQNDYIYVKPELAYLFFPKSSKVLSHGPSLQFNYYFSDTSKTKFENTNVFIYSISMRSRAEFNVWVASDFVKLRKPFDPTNFTKNFLPSDSAYYWKSSGMSFVSKPQRLLTYSVATRIGGFYAGGERYRIDSEVGYRFQPYAALSLGAGYNQLRFGEHKDLPKPLQNDTYNIWLVSNRIDVTLTNKIFFTNFLQLNTQSNNLNINSRFQWRYSPASDLFLVYTDNYSADTFQVRNRAIVLKFTYWWNV